jgi:hypothetical protein
VALIGASLVVLGFAGLAHMMGLVPKSMSVIGRSRGAVAVLRDSNLNDDEKESALQASALGLLRLLMQLLGASAVAALVPIGTIWLLDVLGLMSFEAVLDMLADWRFLLAATVVGTGVSWALQRARA